MIRAKSISVDIALRECLAFHEAFRRLGYPPGCIYVAMHEASELKGGVVPWSILKSPLLPRPVLMMCASVPFSPEEQWEWLALWPDFATAWNKTMTDAERRDIWEASYVANNRPAFVMKMLELGHREPIGNAVLA